MVAIPSVAVEALRVHRIAQHEERLRSGDAWTDLELVFPGLLGELWDPAVFSRAFRIAAFRAGIGSIGPHALRHTAATKMLVLGIHPKVAAEQLGHSSTRMTMDVYSHVVPSGQKDIGTRIHRADRERHFMRALYFTPSALRVRNKAVGHRRRGGEATLRLGRISSMPGSRFRADPTTIVYS